MSKTPVVTLAGVTGQGATTYDWALIPGTRSPQRSYTISDPDGAARAKVEAVLGQLTTFRIEGPRKTLEVRNVYALGIYPGDRPNQFRIAMADVRHKWSKRWVSSAHNVRRATGDLQLLNEQVLENAVLLPREAYAAYSLNDLAIPYTVKEVLDEIFFQLGVNWKFQDAEAEKNLQQVPIENLILDDNGADALERVLAYLPGAGVYVNADGRAVVYDTAARVPALAPEKHIVGRGFSAMADLRGLRPQYINVFFTREVECNFVFRGPRANSVVPLTDDSNELVNVVQVCASSLEIDGVTYVRGSWVPIDDWLDALPAVPSGLGKITQDLIRQLYMGGRLTKLHNHVFGSQFADAVWLRRVDMIRTCWRRTFKIEPTFWSRIAGARALRANVLNYAYGTRAPAEAYCDYMRRPSQKAKNYKTGADSPNIGWAVRGYSDDITAAEAAPVRVFLADAAAGVIQLQPMLDPDGHVDEVTLGYPSGKELPSANMGEINRRPFDMFARWDSIILEDSWNLRTILTVIPASPNNVQKFFKLRVTPEQTVFKGKIGECKGPPVDVRVFPGVTTALMAWSDAGGVGPAILDAIKGLGTWPDDRVSNPKHVQDVALAFASRVYEPFLDRPYGSATIDMDPDFALDANMNSVRHEMVGGACRTRVSYGPVQQARGIWRFLDASTRLAIMRNLEAGKEGSNA